MIVGPGTASALTVDELTAQINALLATLATMQAQLAVLQGGTPATGCTITSFARNLTVGSSGADVKCLQVVLNSAADTKVATTGVGSPGSETTYFGGLTKAAVVKFQIKYAISPAAGYVGPITRAKIRRFELVGVSEAPTFREVLDIAKYVEGITGTRPAFLLAILQEESILTKKFGLCYVTNFDTGEGTKVVDGGTLPKTMHPKRDIPDFLNITQELGKDPSKTPVTCPMSFGWGGAMGPADFIPSTWMLHKDRLQKIIGKLPDPWNIRDAFLASGLYLSDSGAASKTRKGEWEAAMLYFSESINSPYSWYADDVLKIADKLEADIEAIEKIR
jgi:hypothetical protein